MEAQLALVKGFLECGGAQCVFARRDLLTPGIYSIGPPCRHLTRIRKAWLETCADAPIYAILRLVSRAAK